MTENDTVETADFTNDLAIGVAKAAILVGGFLAGAAIVGVTNHIVLKVRARKAAKKTETPES